MSQPLIQRLLKNCVNTLFPAWKKDDQNRKVIASQNRMIFYIFVLCCFFFIGWMSSPSRLRIFIPPDIENGATFKANDIPKPFIYSFAYEIWQEINNWPLDGRQDYKNNLHAYSAYLTPQFMASLLKDVDDLNATGQLNRTRFLEGVAGAAYDTANVKPLSRNSWEVDLKVRLTESNNNQTVKDTTILYPLLITRFDVSRQQNPYGLALAGFVSAPERLNTLK